VPEIRRLLDDAACSHQLSDVPVGMFLSGGLDSTALAILCAKRDAASVNTFTIGVEGRANTDERRQAAATAERLGTRHSTIVLSRSSFRKSVEDWLSSLDQPSVDGLNTYVISEAVRKHGIKVALSGLGSDEIFGGYSTFRDVPRASRLLGAVQWLPARLRKGVIHILCTRCNTTRRQKAVETAVSSPNVRSQYHRRRRLFSDYELEKFGFDLDELGLDESYLVCQDEVDDDPLPLDRASAVSRLECRHYMGNMLLRDSDICGMAHGVEIRVPFLHQPLLEYVMSLPGSWRVSKPGLSKPLLVEALDSDLAYALATQKKRGFTIINAEWMTSVAREPLEDFFETLRHSGHVEPAAISEVWRTFLTDPRGPIWSRIWMLGVLGAWIADRGAQ
jgi:asparagine synthase (glutamine-hydrolysing)